MEKTGECAALGSELWGDATGAFLDPHEHCTVGGFRDFAQERQAWESASWESASGTFPALL